MSQKIVHDEIYAIIGLYFYVCNDERSRDFKTWTMMKRSILPEKKDSLRADDYM